MFHVLEYDGATRAPADFTGEHTLISSGTSSVLSESGVLDQHPCFRQACDLSCKARRDLLHREFQGTAANLPLNPWPAVGGGGGGGGPSPRYRHYSSTPPLSVGTSFHRQRDEFARHGEFPERDCRRWLAAYSRSR